MRLFLTRVQTNADPDFKFRHVPHLKSPDAMKDVKGHIGHLGCMTVAIPIGNS